MSDAAPAGADPHATAAAALQAAEIAASEAAKAAAAAEADVEALKATEAAQGEGAAPVSIQVGVNVTLASGRRLLVRGMRRGPGGLALLGPGDAWIDGTGAVATGSAEG